MAITQQVNFLNDIYPIVGKHFLKFKTTPDELSYEKVEKVVGEEDGRDEKNCCCPIAHQHHHTLSAKWKKIMKEQINNM